MSKQAAIIFDVDGTLTNLDHRVHYLKQTPPDWKTFYEHCYEDKPNENIVWLHNALSEFSGGICFLIVSGRPETCKYDTIEWLKDNNIDYDALYMRDKDDFRADYIIKKEIYEEEIEPEYDVILVIDDRKQVVDMWRSLGLTCLQCKEGEY